MTRQQQACSATGPSHSFSATTTVINPFTVVFTMKMSLSHKVSAKWWRHGRREWGMWAHSEAWMALVVGKAFCLDAIS